MRPYDSVHEDLIEAFPELRRPYERLFADWDDFDGEPPGQTIVFADTLGTLAQIAVRLYPEAAGRDDLLRRIFDFGEALMESADDNIRFLAIDSIAEVVDAERGGRDVWSHFGGHSLKGWYGEYGRTVWHGSEPDEIIDLWGVRGEISHLLEALDPREIPGISHPADYLSIASIEEARNDVDGTVLLSTHGTTRLFAVARAKDIPLDDASLAAAAGQLADFVGGEAPRGEPAAHYRRIPLGERVWNMGRDGEAHARLTEDVWVSDDFDKARDPITKYLTGQTDELVLRRRLW